MKQLIFLLVAGLFFTYCKTSAYEVSAEESNSISVELIQKSVPLFVGQDNAQAVQVVVKNKQQEATLELTGLTVYFDSKKQVKSLAAVAVATKTGEDNRVFARTEKPSKKTELKGSIVLNQEEQTFNLNLEVKEEADLLAEIEIQRVELQFGNGQTVEVQPAASHTYRLAKELRAAGQDQADTYRIPGLVTTNEGTLIAVYDIRYNNSKDLQENIDVGMSRSTDGGQSWEPMRVIMDMGEWGGRSERLNGIGDPSVLYDHTTGTLWVAGLWMSGATEKDMLWWASKPGMSPEVTGQFVLTKSTDDGLTWSEPINVTEQIKDPAWQLLLQGPGRGITLEDGTLVFPAQFKADIGEKALDGGQYSCHSTIVYSQDGGQSWHIGTGAKSNTTEAQVVQLTDGSLMLNMRDDRNRKDKSDTNGRAVATTSDLGKTWTAHATSNSALPESNCMASIISADLNVNGKKQRVLFFSNPNNKNQRTNMTIKTSLDEGMTWPEKYQLELNEAGGYGYSCMTMIDDKTIGILYEGVKNLYFQKIPVAELLGDLTK
ncbi:sialidase family protein [Sunxiuqinia rutila]|uniref:sialidase family protein n=1 Tax=Sunxiuqinia rutila TaxID=1397841 RepID=UPI003D35A0CD